MAGLEPPPAYNAPSSNDTSSDGKLPSYTFPNSFEIGGRLTKSLLVDIPSIKGHLALLNAFSKLKTEVETLDEDILYMPKDSEKRWAWFVALAVERFDVWCRSLQSKDALQPLEDVLPPLDVLMVWHAYMLNPRWYAEDGRRIVACKPLFELGNVLGDELDRLPEILDAPPTDTRINNFYKRVSLPYFPDQSAKVSVSKTIKCPKCRSDILVPYMTTGGTGYLQEGFTFPCPQPDCLDITTDGLRSRKLAENLSREGDAPDSFLPGTFFTDSLAANQKTSRGIISSIRTEYKPGKTEINEDGINQSLCRAILIATHFSMPELRAKLKQEKLTGRIMSAHATPLIYSVELVGAVLRQGSFIKKMVGLEWTTPGFFDAPGHELALRHAIARYHAFLDLMSSSPASFFVPTLDIDLVWHTHQLNSANYEADCKTYVNRFVDHDDKVDGVTLSSSFDLTCRAWKARFGLPYTHCGCPPPGEKFGQRLSRLLSSYQPTPPSYLVPPPEHPEIFAATHASEHNSVQFSARSKQALDRATTLHNEHRARQTRRRLREEKEKEESEKQRREGYETQSCGYGYPFIMPPPLYYGGGAGGCVAANQAMVDHAGACGNGNSVCGGGGCSSGGCGSGGCGGGCGGGGGGGCGGCGGCGG